MLTEIKILDQIEVKPNGVIFIKEYNQILRDGVIISSVPHRSSVCPLDDVSNSPYQMVKDAAAVHWTQSVKDAYAAEVALRNSQLPGI